MGGIQSDQEEIKRIIVILWPEFTVCNGSVEKKENLNSKRFELVK